MTDTPGLDVAGLAQWLAESHPELVGGPLTAHLITGGRSNLTYRIDGARRPLVLRRPPLGHVLSSAHDMAREHRVITALRNAAVPVPPTVDVVDDTATARVTGTPFFVMEFVEGRVLADPVQNADFTSAGLGSLGRELAGILAELHAIDPASVGLEGFGRADGYLERQLATWRRQLDASRSRAVPALDELQEGLGERMPRSARASLVHGDYRLDNALVAGFGDTPRIAAILDWEMATLVSTGASPTSPAVGAWPRARSTRRRATPTSTSSSTPTPSEPASPCPSSRGTAPSRRTSSR